MKYYYTIIKFIYKARASLAQQYAGLQEGVLACRKRYIVINYEIDSHPCSSHPKNKRIKKI